MARVGSEEISPAVRRFQFETRLALTETDAETARLDIGALAQKGRASIVLTIRAA